MKSSKKKNTHLSWHVVIKVCHWMDTFTLESRCWVQWFSKWVPESEHQHHLRISWNENYTELEILGVGSRILCYKLSWCLCSMLKFENHLLWQHNEPTPLRGELNSEDEIASRTFSVTPFRALKEFFSRTNNFTCSTNSVLLHWGKMKSYALWSTRKKCRRWNPFLHLPSSSCSKSLASQRKTDIFTTTTKWSFPRLLVTKIPYRIFPWDC